MIKMLQSENFIGLLKEACENGYELRIVLRGSTYEHQMSMSGMIDRVSEDYIALKYKEKSEHSNIFIRINEIGAIIVTSKKKD